jgi:hypothetical protein
MVISDRLSASDVAALNLACEAFSEVTQRFSAEPLPEAETGAKSADAVIRFLVRDKQFDMPAVISRGAELGAYHLHRAPSPDGRPVILVKRHINRALAEKLIEADIPFLDTAGNVFINEPEATILITGQDRPKIRHTDTTSRSTTPKGLQVSFALASQPDLVEKPYRTIAEVSAVALNTVNLAVDDLIARRLVAMRKGKRTIPDRKQFIIDWAKLYPTGLRTRLGARRFKSERDLAWWQSANLSEFKARLGGESAAEVLTHENKAASVTIYAHGGASNGLKRHALLRPDPSGDIEILDSFWPEYAEHLWATPPAVVHPLLIFADLSASADSRNHYVAEKIYEQFLHHQHSG